MINRSNYEEFFLLYADGELSAADKQAVELFVQEHTDLADELVLFQQMKLSAEDIPFHDKNALYRFAAEEISTNTFEEQFLLYVDNELDAVAKEKVEVFVLQHPAYQESFTLLKQTRLPLEKIVFADKASLYRKEDKKPVVYLYWKRIAVAAALIGLMVLAGKLIPDSSSSKQVLAKLAPAGNNHNQNNTGTAPVVSATKSNTGSNAAQNAGTHTIEQAQQNNTVAENKPVNTTTDNLLAANTNPVLPAENKAEISTSTSGAITEEKTQTAEKISADNTSSANTDIIKTASAAEENATPSQIAHNASYKELDTDDEKKSLYLGSLEINKDKLRGLFRKASSIFRSKAKQEEDNKTETTPRNLK